MQPQTRPGTGHPRLTQSGTVPGPLTGTNRLRTRLLFAHSVTSVDSAPLYLIREIVLNWTWAPPGTLPYKSPFFLHFFAYSKTSLLDRVGVVFCLPTPSQSLIGTCILVFWFRGRPNNIGSPGRFTFFLY